MTTYIYDGPFTDSRQVPITHDHMIISALTPLHRQKSTGRHSSIVFSDPVPATRDILDGLPQQLTWRPGTELYKKVIQDIRQLPPDAEIEQLVTTVYTDLIHDNVVNIYENSPSWFSNEFCKTGGPAAFDEYQAYIYLLTFIDYVNKHQLDHPETVEWCRAHRDQNIPHILAGPKSNHDTIIDYRRHYLSIISPISSSNDMGTYNLTVSTSNVSEDINTFLKDFRSMLNVYHKHLDEARKYTVNITSPRNVQLYLDDGQLVFDFSDVNLGDPTNRQHAVDLDQDLLASPARNPMTSAGKLSDIMNSYSAVHLKSFKIAPNVYQTDLSSYPQLYLVFRGVTSDTRSVYNTASSETFLVGHFTKDRYGWLTFHSENPGWTYRPLTANANKFELLLTTDPDFRNRLLPNIPTYHFDFGKIFNTMVETGIVVTPIKVRVYDILKRSNHNFVKWRKRCYRGKFIPKLGRGGLYSFKEFTKLRAGYDLAEDKKFLRALLKRDLLGLKTTTDTNWNMFGTVVTQVEQQVAGNISKIYGRDHELPYPNAPVTRSILQLPVAYLLDSELSHEQLTKCIELLGDVVTPCYELPLDVFIHTQEVFNTQPTTPEETMDVFTEWHSWWTSLSLIDHSQETFLRGPTHNPLRISPLEDLSDYSDDPDDDLLPPEERPPKRPIRYTNKQFEVDPVNGLIDNKPFRVTETGDIMFDVEYTDSRYLSCPEDLNDLTLVNYYQLVNRDGNLIPERIVGRSEMYSPSLGLRQSVGDIPVATAELNYQFRFDAPEDPPPGYERPLLHPCVKYYMNVLVDSPVGDQLCMWSDFPGPLGAQQVHVLPNYRKDMELISPPTLTQTGGARTSLTTSPPTRPQPANTALTNTVTQVSKNILTTQSYTAEFITPHLLTLDINDPGIISTKDIFIVPTERRVELVMDFL